MVFKDKEKRENCYAIRDIYFECIGDRSAVNPGEDICKAEAEKFEEACGRLWAVHFKRRRDYERFKDKLLSGTEEFDKEKILK